MQYHDTTLSICGRIKSALPMRSNVTVSCLYMYLISFIYYMDPLCATRQRIKSEKLLVFSFMWYIYSRMECIEKYNTMYNWLGINVLDASEPQVRRRAVRCVLAPGCTPVPVAELGVTHIGAALLHFVSA